MPSFSNLTRRLPNPSLKLPSPSLSLSLGPRSGRDVVGLDIQPGFVGAVQARVNGSIVAERAAVLPLPADAVREGEVVDEGQLSTVLRDLFAKAPLSRRVRVGVANQRTVMRTLELPPMTDRKELAAAVQFQAQDQVPMPLSNAVLDFHPLGIVDTPAGPRQHVVLVAAQRDMIEHLLAAVRGAGLQPVGIDLSAFALIRSLYQPETAHEGQPEHVSRVVYLNVDGLTNLAIAEGLTCRFTRVVGGGLEGMAGELAERRGIPLTDARAMLAAVDLTKPVPVEEFSVAPLEVAPQDIVPDWLTSEEALPEDGVPSDAAHEDAVSEDGGSEEGGIEGIAFDGGTLPVEDAPGSAEAYDALEGAMSFSEMSSLGPSREPQAEPAPVDALEMDADARRVLENGVREISGEVRNSLDFHRSQDGGGEVSHVVLSGSALDLPGFAEALEAHLGLEVRTETVRQTGESSRDSVSMHRLAVAAGLATGEMHQ
jgi:type IV pilus assembly protein PilM